MFTENYIMETTNQQAFFCIYCGISYLNQFMLEQISCLRHPLGSGKGKHIIYSGVEKEKYQCQFCSHQAQSISELTKDICKNHPYKLRRGRHIPE